MAPATKERVDVILGWLANQGPSTVLLFLILVGGSYTVQKIVPAHLQQIQNGYEQIEARQVEQNRTTNEAHSEQIRAINADRAEERAFMREVLDRRETKPFAGVNK